MAAAENVVTGIKDKSSLAPMQVLVRGRIESSSVHEGTRETKIMTPAVDEFSRPQLLEIRSKSRIGEKGEMVTVKCQLGGYQRKAFTVKDKATGEMRTVVPVEHTLDLIDEN
ncbi:single-stranded DNA-binding protein [Undibacterium sp. Tian12W]|uniref:single-stranded DNA-binding protein n=1 Tax=Undibacterium sp. Tian12W TaxID=3413054 RepID=UPI003BF43649